MAPDDAFDRHELLNHRAEDLAALSGRSQRHSVMNLEGPETAGRIARRQRAKTLLVSSDDRLANVARACGYRSLGLFTAAFI